MAYTVAFETEVATSRKRKSVGKLTFPLCLEQNLGGEEVPVAGKVMSAGASAMHLSVRVTERLRVFFI